MTVFEGLPEEVMEEMSEYMVAYAKFRKRPDCPEPIGLLAKVTAHLRALGFKHVYTHKDIVDLILED